MSCVDRILRNTSDLIYSMVINSQSTILHVPHGPAMALRRWRISKRCCQVVKYLAKEPSIKVEVKSLPQPARLGWKVTVVEYDPAVMSTIGMHWSTCCQCFQNVTVASPFAAIQSFGVWVPTHGVCSQRLCNRHYRYSRSDHCHYLFLH